MVKDTNEVYTYHYDAVGNTIAMTDETENIVNMYAYTPFGILANENETVPQPFKFVGKYGVMTEPNGFYYMRARYYDTEVGRFISEDPIGFDGGDVNLYAYVGNNPVLFIDPGGLFRFGKRPLNGLPWIPGASSNPIDDAFNTEISHEHGFFEDGSGDNIGFGPGGRFSEDAKGYRYDTQHYDDALMREALKNVKDGDYSLLGFGKTKNNCQDWAYRLRGEYHRLQNK
jgi:RHS repeat-associated protein